MYSCKVSFADWVLEWILVAACTFVATGLNSWHSLFFTASHVDEGGITSFGLYAVPLAFAPDNCISGCWVSLAIS